jgi:GT2 family glycosyltransferase
MLTRFCIHISLERELFAARILTLEELAFMSDNQEVSVIICAYTEHRWDDTIAAVSSALDSQPEPLEVILVIDHNPTLFDRFLAYYSQNDKVSVVQNNNIQGLSGARNTGIVTANGKYIGFLDDDALMEEDTLGRLVQWCLESDIVGAGGKVLPLWVGDHSQWFPTEFYWVFGCSYRGLPETATVVRNPFGGSMVVRRELFEEVGGFRTGTGRIGDVPLGCEETELSIRAWQHRPEWKFIYDPRAVFWHRVPEGRTKWPYFRARCYNEGLSKALLSRLVGSAAGLSAERSYTTEVLPLGVLRGIRDTLFRFDISGLGRSFAIIAGLAVTASGYLIGLLQTTSKQAKQKAVVGDIGSLQS